MKKSKCLRLDSLVLSKEGLLVCPELLLGTAEHWERLLSIPQHPLPPSPAQGPEAHTSWAKEGWLTHPQSLELHLDSCPKIYDFHAQSYMSGSTL